MYSNTHLNSREKVPLNVQMWKKLNLFLVEQALGDLAAAELNYLTALRLRQGLLRGVQHKK